MSILTLRRVPSTSTLPELHLVEPDPGRLDPGEPTDFEEAYRLGYDLVASGQCSYPTAPIDSPRGYRGAFREGARDARRDDRNRAAAARGWEDGLACLTLEFPPSCWYDAEEELHYLRGYRKGAIERDAREDALLSGHLSDLAERSREMDWAESR